MLVTISNRVVQGVAPLPHRLWLLITDVTAKLTFDRCVCYHHHWSFSTVFFSPLMDRQSNAGESGVAACVLLVKLLHCSQTGLHGEEPSA